MSLLRPHIILALAVAASLLVAGCGRAKERPGTSLSAADSVRAADSAAAAAAVPALSYEAQQGRDIFMKYCAVCHGTEGKGDGFNAFNLDPKPRNLTDAQYMKTLTEDRLTQTIREGGRGVNRSSLMPSWGARLTKNEILDVAAFVRTLAVDSGAAAK
jgi:mono/diheme cytochrome c family protein